MSFFSDWAAKLGDKLVGLIPGAHAILLRKADDSLDILGSNGSGAANVAVTSLPATAATAAKQDTGNAALATMAECTLAPTADGTITKGDATLYNPPLRSIWATGAGNLTLMLSGDTVSVVTIPVAANEKITFLSISRVMTATTATGISGAL